LVGTRDRNREDRQHSAIVWLGLQTATIGEEEDLNYKATRRRFLVGLGSLAGTVALRAPLLRGLIGGTQSAQAGARSVGSFVLLSDGDPVPANSKLTASVPNFDGVTANGTSPAIAKSFDSPGELAKGIGIPMYELASPPSWLALGPINAVQNNSGQVYSATVGYQTKIEDALITVVDVTASEIYLSPMPVWDTRINDDVHAVAAVDYLPAPGVHQVAAEGHVFHWIERGVLYRLRAEYRGDLASAKDLAMSLKRII
jgi:hypothetical protein